MVVADTYRVTSQASKSVGFIARLVHFIFNENRSAKQITGCSRTACATIKKFDKGIRGQCRVVKGHYALPTRACKTTDAAYHHAIV
jgi:hypothetical protein